MKKKIFTMVMGVLLFSNVVSADSKVIDWSNYSFTQGTINYYDIDNDAINDISVEVTGAHEERIDNYLHGDLDSPPNESLYVSLGYNDYESYFNDNNYDISKLSNYKIDLKIKFLKKGYTHNNVSFKMFDVDGYCEYGPLIKEKVEVNGLLKNEVVNPIFSSDYNPSGTQDSFHVINDNTVEGVYQVAANESEFDFMYDDFKGSESKYGVVNVSFNSPIDTISLSFTLESGQNYCPYPEGIDLQIINNDFRAISIYDINYNEDIIEDYVPEDPEDPEDRNDPDDSEDPKDPTEPKDPEEPVDQDDKDLPQTGNQQLQSISILMGVLITLTSLTVLHRKKLTR